ncbi:MAG: STAS domain-containing protein [Actinomycetota bacterium]|nr:STAS domain-containing protein [Actinomycetota bacterium]
MVQYRIAARTGDAVLLQLSGELAHFFRTEQLRRALEDHFVDDGVKVIRVDLSPVTFMDSYGVATLVSLLKESQERGKKFLVEGAQGQVREKLGVTGVLKVLQRGT